MPRHLTLFAFAIVFFTDQPNDRILKWSVDGKLSAFLEPAGRSNGMYFDGSGNLIACADEKNELWSIAKDGKAAVIRKESEGKTLYVADIKAGTTNAYDIQPDGSLAGKRQHCALGSDGMTLDEEGNL